MQVTVIMFSLHINDNCFEENLYSKMFFFGFNLRNELEKRNGIRD